MMHPAHGLLGDRYRLRDLLKAVPGRETWLADDGQTGQPVVIKLTSVSRLPAAGRWRLLREVEILLTLQHPSLVPILASGFSDDYFFVAVPFSSALTLRRRLQDGPLDVQQATEVALDVLRGLEAAHQHGVLHRNLSSANVLIGSPCQLMDFSPLGVSEMPDEGVLPTYLAPEQSGLLHNDVDARSDLYAVGALLYECITGRPPFLGANLTELLQHQMTETVPPMRSMVQSVPRALDELVARLLARDPRGRYQSTAGVLWDLDALHQAREAGTLDPEVPIGLFDRRHTLAEPAFVGRREELATLSDYLDRVRDGRGGVLSIEAASGLGKSRLLQEAGLLALQQGMLVLRYASRPQSAEHPFEVFAGLVSDLQQRLTRTEIHELFVTLQPRQRSVLRSLVPPMRELDPDQDDGSPAVSSNYVLDVLTAWLQRLGHKERPAIILLDDAQWADPLTRKVLQRFHQVASFDSHALVIATCRVGEGDGELSRVARLVLTPFDSDDTRHLIESMAGPLPVAAHELIGRVSEGSPFMAAETLRALVAAGGLKHDTAAWQFDVGITSDPQTTLRAAAALSRRLERVSGPARRLLATAAALGRDCDMELLAAVSQSTPQQLLEAVEEARQAHLVWRGADGTRLTFAHDRLREALLLEVPRATTESLHRAAAQWIKEHHPNQIFDMAYHLEQADAPEEALPWALASAAEARRRHALDTAARYYAMAAKAIGQSDDAVQLAMFLDYADVNMRLGRFVAADQLLRSAQSKTDGPIAAGRLEGLRARLALERRDPQGAMLCAEAGLFLMDLYTVSTDAVSVKIRLMLYLAEAAWRLGQVEKALSVCRRADETRQADALLYAVWARILAHTGHMPQALTHVEKARRMADRFEDPVDQARVLMAIAPACLLAGQVDTAVACADEARTVMARGGDARETNLAVGVYAEALMAAGRVRDAATLAEQVYNLAVETEDVQTQALALRTWSRASNAPLPTQVVDRWLLAETVWPDDIEAHANLTEALTVWHLRNGHGEAAAALLERYEADEGSTPLAILGNLLCWRAVACRRVAESLPVLAVLARGRWLGKAGHCAGRAMAIAKDVALLLPAALREVALSSASHAQVELARQLFEDGTQATREQRYQAAILQLARHQVGHAVGWADAETDGVEARRALARMDISSIPEIGIDLVPRQGPVTVSLVDRFSNVIASGRRLVSSQTLEDLLSTLQDTARTLLRAEALYLWEAETRRFVGTDAPPLAALLRDRVNDSGQPMALDVERDGRLGEPLLLSPERCGLGLPIKVGGHIRYILVATHTQTAGLFGTDELQLADYLGSVGGAVLENQENVEARFESEARFRVLYERADVGIALLSPRGDILECNPFLCHSTGYEATELVTRQFESLISPLHRDRARRDLQPLLAGQEDHCRLEIACRRKSGELLWMELAASLVRAQDGRPRFVIAAMSDMSHRRLEQVVGFQETERRILSTELHDTIAQPLVGLYYGLQNIESTVSDATLTQVRRLGDQTERVLGELRALISNISVPEADSFDALSALEQYVHDFRADSGLEVRLWRQGTSPPKVAGVSGLFIYRMIQEALRNVARHAEAANVVVRIDVRPRRVRAAVVDNGQGFTPKPIEGRHFGLRGMRERAELLGGWCRVRSREGHGTRVVFEIPLQP